MAHFNACVVSWLDFFDIFYYFFLRWIFKILFSTIKKPIYQILVGLMNVFDLEDRGKEKKYHLNLMKLNFFLYLKVLIDQKSTFVHQFAFSSLRNFTLHNNDRFHKIWPQPNQDLCVFSYPYLEYPAKLK